MSDDPGTEQYRRVAEGLLEAVIDALIGRKDDLIQHLVANAKLASTEPDLNGLPSVAPQRPDEDIEHEPRQPGQSGSQVTDSDAGLAHHEVDGEDDDLGPERWKIDDDDLGVLMRLAQKLRALSPLTQSGTDLIGLGEALNAIEQIIEGTPVDVNVYISLGFERGDNKFAEGLFLGFRVNEEEIVLDELRTRYEAPIGGEHLTNVYAVRGPHNRFDSCAVEEWIIQLEEVQASDDAQLEVERDHI